MAATYYDGNSLKIVHTDDFLASLREIVGVHHKNLDAHLARANKLITVLGDTGRLRSPDQFRQETSGFWAIKAGDIRVYGWYGEQGTFVLSHAIFKASTKLAAADIRRMNNNRANFGTKAKK